MVCIGAQPFFLIMNYLNHYLHLPKNMYVNHYGGLISPWDNLNILYNPRKH